MLDPFLIPAKSQASILTSKGDNVDPQERPRLSSDEVYNSVRVSTPCNDGLSLRLSKRSFKTSNYEAVLENLKPWSRLPNEVFKTLLEHDTPPLLESSIDPARSAKYTMPLLR